MSYIKRVIIESELLLKVITLDEETNIEKDDFERHIYEISESFEELISSELDSMNLKCSSINTKELDNTVIFDSDDYIEVCNLNDESLKLVVDIELNNNSEFDSSELESSLRSVYLDSSFDVEAESYDSFYSGANDKIEVIAEVRVSNIDIIVEDIRFEQLVKKIESAAKEELDNAISKVVNSQTNYNLVERLDIANEIMTSFRQISRNKIYEADIQLSDSNLIFKNDYKEIIFNYLPQSFHQQSLIQFIIEQCLPNECRLNDSIFKTIEDYGIENVWSSYEELQNEIISNYECISIAAIEYIIQNGNSSMHLEFEVTDGDDETVNAKVSLDHNITSLIN